MSKTIKIKRVSAYPFKVQFKTAAETVQGQLVKLTQQGFLAEIPFTKLQPGDRFECTFEIPVLHHWVTEAGRLIKLYNQWNGGNAEAAGGAQNPGEQPTAVATPPAAPAAKVVQLAEVHFQGLGEENRDAIGRFMQAIKQAK